MDNVPVSLIDLFTQIEKETDFSFSYSTVFLQDLDSLNISDKNIGLEELLDYISLEYYLDYEVQDAFQKILLSRKKDIRLSGNVYDADSGESLQDVLIYYSDGVLGSSNSEGYFSITLKADVDSVFFNYLGYLPQNFSRKKLLSGNTMIALRSENILENVIITEDEKSFQSVFPEEKINRDNLAFSQSITGSDDVFAYIRTLPGVSVGSEGQNGLLVRGGGPDQNLVLIDGMPVYEASHLGGLSSVFLSEAIKNVDFYKSAFPARYGGKLSSILDVRLKDGHRTEFKRSVALGIEGIEGHIEGPLGKSTTINLNGRYSWFSLLAKPILESSLSFNTSDLNYSDAYIKLSHWFSPSNRLSLSFYTGNDLIRLVRDEDPGQQVFSFNDVNRIEWGNHLLSAHWNLALNNKMFLNSSVGLSTFNYSSRGAYKINYVEDDTLRSNSFDILSNSELRDIIIQSRLDHYTEDYGKISFGLVSTLHKNAPSIKESDIYLDPELLIATGLDSTYYSNEYALFIENQRYFGNDWMLESGLRINYFSGIETNNLFFLPRLSLRYEKK